MKNIFILFCLCSFYSCQPELEKQPKLNVYDRSTFYPDQSANRLPVEGSIPYRFINEEQTIGPPQKIDRQFLIRGQDRYEIFCTVCHGLLGDGQGIVTQRGFTPPPSFHSERLRNVKPEYIYNVITHGKGRMTRLSDRIPPQDRWAIAYYVRVLQMSQNLESQSLPPKEKQQLENK